MEQQEKQQSVQRVQVIDSSFLLPLAQQALAPAPANGGIPGSSTPLLHLVILNWSLPKWLLSLWPTAVVRMCADGGANRLYDELPAMLPDKPADQVRTRYVPDLIHGDLDSLRPEVRQFYVALGVPVVQCPDQDSTDLGKCIHYLKQRHARTLLLHAPLGQQPADAANDGSCAAGAGGAGGAEDGSGSVGGVDMGDARGVAAAAAAAQEEEADLEVANASQGVVLAVGALGGRLDHTLSNLSALHAHRRLSLALVGEGNLVRLVRAGRCVIRPVRQHEGPLCGLVPLTGPATVTMTGFRWNLERSEMRVGGLVSTSNIMESDTITVETDVDLVWTTQLHDPPAL